MKTKRTFTSQQKADIVLGVITKTETVLELANKNTIAPALVYKWKEEFCAKAHEVFETNKDDVEKDRKIKHYEQVIAKITTQNDFLDKVLAATR